MGKAPKTFRLLVEHSKSACKLPLMAFMGTNEVTGLIKPLIPLTKSKPNRNSAIYCR